MKDFNTLKARHFSVIKGNFVLHGKEYYWHIPKDLRHLNIQKGDVVLINERDKRQQAIVTDVFRENIEDTGKRYKPIWGKVKNRKYNFVEN